MGIIATEELLRNFPPEAIDHEDYELSVKGTTHRDPKELAAVREDDFVMLQPEFGNTYDPYAVMVLHDLTGAHLGYVDMKLSEDIWKNIRERGHAYFGKIKIIGKGKEHQGFIVKVRHVWRKDQGGS